MTSTKSGIVTLATQLNMKVNVSFLFAMKVNCTHIIVFIPCGISCTNGWP